MTLITNKCELLDILKNGYTVKITIGFRFILGGTLIKISNFVSDKMEHLHTIIVM